MVDFEDMFQALVDEPAFKRLKRSFTNYSFFQFGRLKEDHTTNLINWLLNPREAHGSFIFFEYFLDAVYKALDASIVKNKDHLLSEVENIRNSREAQNRYIFETEQNMGGQSRCDIVGVSLEGNVSIFIENKVTSDLSGPQLGVYRKYADKNSADKIPLLILMDATLDRDLLNTTKNKAYSKRWVHVSYDWLGESIQDYLSGPVPQDVSTILKSFQTELESFISTNLNQSNIYWADAWKDVEALGNTYHSLWQDETYKTIRDRTAFQIAKNNTALPRSAVLIYQYPEIFDALEEYGFFNTLEDSETSILGFSYETDIHRKNVYFYPGTLPNIEDYWPVNLKLSQQTLEPKTKKELPKDVYMFSLGYAPKTVSNEYAELVKSYFLKKEFEILQNKPKNHQVEQLNVKKHLIACLKDLHRELLLFEKSPEYQKYLKSL